MTKVTVSSLFFQGSLVSLYFCMYFTCDTNGIVLEVKEVAYTVEEVKDAHTGSFYKLQMVEIEKG